MEKEQVLNELALIVAKITKSNRNLGTRELSEIALQAFRLGKKTGLEEALEIVDRKSFEMPEFFRMRGI